MKTHKENVAFAALTLVVMVTSAHADDAVGWYGGLSLGQSRTSIDEDRIANRLAAAGFTQTEISKDTRDLAFKVFGGYQFNRYFALEGAYLDLGEFGFVANTQPAGALTGDVKFKGVSLNAVGTLPLTSKLSALGRAGVNYTEAEAAFSGTGAVQVGTPRRDERATNYKVGVGLEYALAPRLGLRAELERYRVKDSVGNRGDIDVASLGVVYRFKANPVAAVQQSEAVMPAAASPSQLTPPPPPPPTQRSLSLSADSQFDFDRAVVKPAGKQALDQFAVDLKGSRYEAITVTGHTDRLGSEAYNAELSSRRADAVKTYLVESADIPASKIEARGVGESMPLTLPGACEAELDDALIACLQADRRVQVEATVIK